MEKIKELFVVLENKPGAAGELLRVLKKINVSVYAVAMFIDFARLHVSDPEKAYRLLPDYGYQVELSDALRVVLPNRRGVLMELALKIGNAGVNIDYMYCALQEKQKQGTVILEVDQPDLVIDLFKNHKF
jgi:hypothetical protein